MGKQEASFLYITIGNTGLQEPIVSFVPTEELPAFF